MHLLPRKDYSNYEYLQTSYVEAMYQIEKQKFMQALKALIVFV